MHQFAFVMDQQVGLRTQALNWERVVDEDATVTPTWIPVRYEAPAGPLSTLPGVPSGIKGTLRGVGEIRSGVGDASRFESILWASWAAKSVLDLVSATPAFLIMDMTPVQMEAMGALYGYSSFRARFGAGFKRRATDRLYHAARHFFPWNDWVAASLREDYGISPERITPISPGVDQALFTPGSEVRPKGAPVRLLFVGGNFARKGGDLLLRWARETEIETPWELNIVTRDAVPQTPHTVVCPGLANNSPELVRLYQESDVFVLPTLADCYSLVAMEAMSCGLPVVTTRLGGIPEIVADGETGFLLEAGEYSSLALRLDQLVTDGALRQSMGAASLSRARERFDCRVNMGRILDVMKTQGRQ